MIGVGLNFSWRNSKLLVLPNLTIGNGLHKHTMSLISEPDFPVTEDHFKVRSRSVISFKHKLNEVKSR